MDSPFSSSPKSTRRLAAVMFTDIVGYSKMMASDEAATLDFLHGHNQIVKTALDAHRGRVVKTIGDSFMVEFASVGDALQSACEIHRALAASEEGRANPRRIRIGIHLGEVNVSPEGDLFGDTVNFAARLEPQAPVGGICVSQAVVNQMRSRQEWNFQSIGKKQLKNIPGESELYFLSAAGLELGDLAERLRIRRRWFAASITALIAIGLGASPAWKIWEQWKQDRGWKLVFEQTLSSSASQTRFRIPDGSQAPEGVLLRDWHPMYTVESLPFKGTRVKVRFKRTDPGWGGITVCLANSLAERTTSMAGAANNERFKDIDAWGPKGGLFTQLEPAMTNFNLGGWHAGGVNHNDSSFLNVQKPGFLPPSSHEITFTFEKDMMILDGPNGERLETLYREPQAFDRSRYWVALDGFFVVVQSVTVYTRIRGEEDLFSAAESNLGMGRTEIGVAMLDDLLEKTTDKETVTRLLYRKAMALTSQGDLKAADLIYRKLIRDFPDNKYVGFARIDLALLYVDAAEKIRQKGGPAQKDLTLYAQGADRILGDLISKQPDHPEYWRAKWQQARNCLFNLRDDARANELYEALLSDLDYPYSFHTCTELWANLEKSTGTERVRLGRFIEGLYKEMQEKYSGNKNIMGALDGARRHHLAEKH